MNLKRNIAVCVACILLVGLGAAMILSGCGEETPIPDGGTTVGGTTAGTGETTQPDGTDQTQPSGQGQQGTDPTGSSDPTNAPSDPTDPSQPGEKTYLTYEEYRALSGEEQQEYMYTFKKPDGSLDVKAFNDWYKEAHDTWLAQQDREELDPDHGVDLD